MINTNENTNNTQKNIKVQTVPVENSADTTAKTETEAKANTATNKQETKAVKSSSSTTEKSKKNTTKTISSDKRERRKKVAQQKKKKTFIATMLTLFAGNSHFSNDDASKIENDYGAKEIYANSENSNPRQQAIYRNIASNSIKVVWLTFFAFFAIFVWAGLFQLDSIVRGSGQIVPSQRIQEIQNLEGGILREILVREGTQVEEGELLARIENESAGSQYREAVSRSLDYKAGIARLVAIIEDKKVEYPNEVLVHADLVLRHNTILQAMLAQTQSEYNVIKLQADAKEREVSELEARKIQADSRLEIAQRQRDLGKSALEKQAFSELEFLELENNLIALQSDIESLEHSIPRAKIEAEEMQERLKRFEAEKHLTNSQELARLQAELISIEELLTAGSDRVSRTELRSPVRGIINRLNHNTIGGVVAPAATIMEIVPLDDRLIIEARFSPADIAFLSEGLPAIIRLSAYDFASYGSVRGIVEQVSADTLRDNAGNIYYIAKIRTDEKMYGRDGQELPYIAGMQAEIDVITGKQSILNYILKPLMRIKNRALTER